MAVGHTVTACGANIRPNLLVSGGGCEETGTQIVIFGNHRGFSPVRMSTTPLLLITCYLIYQPIVPGSPLKGPTISLVIQPP